VFAPAGYRRVTPEHFIFSLKNVFLNYHINKQMTIYIDAIPDLGYYYLQMSN